MKVAVMQPYFFAYIGYWQLINAVDVFVIYDDVNFIKKGYINRNNILLNNKPYRITLELLGASQNKLINEIYLGDNRPNILKIIKQAYSKAPYFRDVYNLLEKIMTNEEKNLGLFLEKIIKNVSSYMGIDTNFIRSSNLNKDNDLRGQDKILQICQLLDADIYINAIGGRELYDKKAFRDESISLNFIESEIVEYPQFGNEFCAYLSIVDVLMFNSISDIKEMLNKYKLI
ncbi:WbqC family protein [Francisella philomiragia]|uniref:WbqC family protein n=1 Tax=Francisella philomiragia TaxID=28110 RepID=UPI001908D713|nr:WbqC family protein [Francisella philomiragia]MBK2267743.1 WbqC family protein [Francisella philomiragia]MBK2279159.1 WbqC family protein [Francisella philomiragia]MBK2287052.1 WbqC family protein [Francisella philomiragia]MBK2288991.1 WbqC family protein [Francisella philomiragia]MBK2290709.1 WbqC family protein [Francisella philomiragia]